MPKATRGTGFPSLSLEEAVAAIKSAGQYGRAHTDAAFAGYLGHSSANSGPFRSKMAALRDFGLIERPKNGQIPMTELGHEIAHPTGDERALLQRAFFSAKPFETIYNESAKGTDLSLELIANRAVTALGVSAQNKTRFAESFRQSVLAAALGRGGDSEGTIRLIPPGSEPAEPELPAEESKAGAATDGAGGTASTTAPPLTHVRTGRPPVIHQEWPVDGGRVVFEVSLDGALPGSAFAQVANVMTAVEEFVSSLGPAEEPTKPESVDDNGGAGASE
jgi:hypothetical protein